MTVGMGGSIRTHFGDSLSSRRLQYGAAGRRFLACWLFRVASSALRAFRARGVHVLPLAIRTRGPSVAAVLLPWFVSVLLYRLFSAFDFELCPFSFRLGRPQFRLLPLPFPSIVTFLVTSFSP